MQIRFGLVKQIQFRDPQGQPVQACGLGQGLCNQGALANPAYSVFSMGDCGDNSPEYLAYNGPQDNDGENLNREAVDWNDRVMAQMQSGQLDEPQRESFFAEKRALFQKYLDKASGTIDVTVNGDGTFSFIA